LSGAALGAPNLTSPIAPLSSIAYARSTASSIETPNNAAPGFSGSDGIGYDPQRGLTADFQRKGAK
jgi:hypothetical protein